MVKDGNFWSTVNLLVSWKNLKVTSTIREHCRSSHIAHVHCVPSEKLGFRIIEGDGQPIFDDDVQHDEEAEDPQPVQKTPADVPAAEPLGNSISR